MSNTRLSTEKTSTSLLMEALNGAKKIISSGQRRQDGQINILTGSMILTSAFICFAKAASSSSLSLAALSVAEGIIGTYLLKGGIQSIYEGAFEQFDGRQIISNVEVHAKALGIYSERQDRASMQSDESALTPRPVM